MASPATTAVVTDAEAGRPATTSGFFENASATVELEELVSPGAIDVLHDAVSYDGRSAARRRAAALAAAVASSADRGSAAGVAPAAPTEVKGDRTPPKASKLSKKTAGKSKRGKKPNRDGDDDRVRADVDDDDDHDDDDDDDRLADRTSPMEDALPPDDDANEEESDDGLAFRLQVIQITEAEVADVGRVYALTLSDGVNFHGFFLHPRLAHYVESGALQKFFAIALRQFVIRDDDGAEVVSGSIGSGGGVGAALASSAKNDAMSDLFGSSGQARFRWFDELEFEVVSKDLQYVVGIPLPFSATDYTFEDSDFLAQVAAGNIELEEAFRAYAPELMRQALEGGAGGARNAEPGAGLAGINSNSAIAALAAAAVDLHGAPPTDADVLASLSSLDAVWAKYLPFLDRIIAPLEEGQALDPLVLDGLKKFQTHFEAATEEEKLCVISFLHELRVNPALFDLFVPPDRRVEVAAHLAEDPLWDLLLAPRAANAAPALRSAAPSADDQAAPTAGEDAAVAIDDNAGGDGVGKSGDVGGEGGDGGDGDGDSPDGDADDVDDDITLSWYFDPGAPITALISDRLPRRRTPSDSGVEESIMQVLSVRDVHASSPSCDPLYFLTVSDGRESTAVLLAGDQTHLVDDGAIAAGCIVRLAKLSVCLDREREVPWFECDACRKWRRLTDEDVERFSEDFVCSMNPDPDYNSCDAPPEATRAELEKVSAQIDQLVLTQVPTIVAHKVAVVAPPRKRVGSPLGCDEYMLAQELKWFERNADSLEGTFYRPVTYASTIPPPSAVVEPPAPPVGIAVKIQLRRRKSKKKKKKKKKGGGGGGGGGGGDTDSLIQESEFVFKAGMKMGKMMSVVAEEVGVSASAIHHYFHGKRLHAYETVEAVGLKSGQTITCHYASAAAEPAPKMAPAAAKALEAESLKRQEALLRELEAEEEEQAAREKRKARKKNNKKKKAKSEAAAAAAAAAATTAPGLHDVSESAPDGSVRPDKGGKATAKKDNNGNNNNGNNNNGNNNNGNNNNGNNKGKKNNNSKKKKKAKAGGDRLETATGAAGGNGRPKGSVPGETSAVKQGGSKAGSQKANDATRSPRVVDLSVQGGSSGGGKGKDGGKEPPADTGGPKRNGKKGRNNKTLSQGHDDLVAVAGSDAGGSAGALALHQARFDASFLEEDGGEAADDVPPGLSMPPRPLHAIPSDLDVARLEALLESSRATVQGLRAKFVAQSEFIAARSEYVGALEEANAAMRAEVEFARGELLCRTCSSARRTGVVLPCAHNQTCVACLAGLAACPVCGTRIADVIEILP